MLRKLIFIVVLGIAPCVHAGCSGEFTGRSGLFVVDIGDDSCLYSEMMLRIRSHRAEVDPEHPYDVVQPFSKACVQAAGGISCSRTAPKPMSGVKYQWTKDTNPSCPGDKIGRRLTCVLACAGGAPPYLYGEPYEC
jgi:hypothetical protein